MRFALAILLFAFAVASCKKGRDNPEDNVIIDSISPAFFVKQTRPYPTAEALTARAKFLYAGNMPVRRSGAILSIWSWDVTDDMFDTVKYVNSSTIIIQSGKRGFENANFPKWEITLQSGLPVKRISYVWLAAQGQYYAGDTAFYFYNAKNQIEKIESHSTIYPYSYLSRKEFTFNADGNLVKINTAYIRKPAQVVFTIVEELGMYDNAKNPLKRLWIWDDLYYRSLSANNFAKYNYARFDAANNPTELSEQVIPLQYDSKGNILLFP